MTPPPYPQTKPAADQWSICFYQPPSQAYLCLSCPWFRRLRFLQLRNRPFVAFRIITRALKRDKAIRDPTSRILTLKYPSSMSVNFTSSRICHGSCFLIICSMCSMRMPLCMVNASESASPPEKLIINRPSHIHTQKNPCIRRPGVQSVSRATMAQFLHQYRYTDIDIGLIY